MQGVAAGIAFGEQVGPDQLGEEALRASHRDAAEAGGGVAGEVRPGVEPEQPQQPGRVRAQHPVRPGEHVAQVRGRVTAGQGGQGVGRLAQPRRQHLERQSGSGGRAGRRDGDRQRQPRAPVEDGPGRLRLAGHPVGPDPPREQVVRLLLRQRVQAQRLGALGGDQGGELVPAGDDGQAAGRTGQQRADLLGVPGVVQHDQHPPRRQHAAVQRGPGVEVGRDPGGGHPERAQEVGQHRVRVERRCARVEPAQVHVQLAVRELPGDPVGPVHGEGGLAHARHAGHRRDRHRRRGGGGRLPLRGEDGVQAGELVHPPGEAGDRERQLRRQRRGGVRRGDGGRRRWRWRVELGGLAQDRRLQLAQRGARADAELLVEQVPQPLVGREGLLLPTGAVQRQHQLPVHGLLERKLPGQGLQLGHQPGGLAQRQPGVEQPLHRDQPQPLQPVRVLAEPVQTGHVGQRRPTPQAERRAVAGGAPRRVVALPWPARPAAPRPRRPWGRRRGPAGSPGAGRGSSPCRPARRGGRRRGAAGC